MRARRAAALVVGGLCMALGCLAPAIAVAGSTASSGMAHGSTDSLRLCDAANRLTAAEQDRLLRFAEIAREELDATGERMALVSRSGLDLSRFAVRYSHGGISLRDSENGRWSVRQLYYACDEGRPRIFDQGLPGFVSGTDDPTLGYLSMVTFDGPEAQTLAAAALDRRRALALVGGRYSANAYPYGLRYQNCNQWLIELIASAWAGRPLPSAADSEPEATARDGATLARQAAQDWLRRQGYQPEPVRVDSHLVKFAAGFVPWIHLDDHPGDARYGLEFRTSLPRSIEAFVRERHPAARRVEMCHDERQIVVRRDGPPLGEGCRAAPGDRVVRL